MNWKQFLSGGPEKVEAATAALRKEMSDCMACMGRWHEACMPRADRLTLLVMSIEDDMAPTRDWEPYATCASGCFVHCSRAPLDSTGEPAGLG
jgi:hypothetical protein